MTSRLFSMFIVVAAGACAAIGHEQVQEPQEPADQEVLQWLEKVPHSRIWFGISKWETDEERRYAHSFDHDAWVAEGRKIRRIEPVLRQLLLENRKCSVDLSRVAYALGWVGTSKSVPVLIDCLSREDKDNGCTRLQAIVALGELRDPRAVHPLGSRVMLLVEREENELIQMMSALAQIGDERAMRYLNRALNEGDPAVSEWAKAVISAEATENTDVEIVGQLSVGALPTPRPGYPPGLPLQGETTLTYPRRVMIPEDLPSTYTVQPVAGSSEQPILIFPVAAYVVAHYDGWQEFLDRVGNRGERPDAATFRPAPVKTGNPFTQRGLQDGFMLCRSNVLELLDQHPAHIVREMAKKGYQPRPSPDDSPRNNQGIRE